MNYLPVCAKLSVCTYLPFIIRLVLLLTTAGDESLDTFSARAQVRFMESITTEQDEILVRSVHPSLRACDPVCVAEADDGRLVWVIMESDLPLVQETMSAAGRDIKLIPDFETQPMQPGAPVRPDPAPEPFLDLRVSPSKADIHRLCLFFPGAIGMQYGVPGLVIVLFRDKKTMEKCWDLGYVEQYSGLRVGYALREEIAGYPEYSQNVVP